MSPCLHIFHLCLDIELSPTLGDDQGSGGSGLRLQSYGLDFIVELYTEDDHCAFRKIPIRSMA